MIGGEGKMEGAFDTMVVIVEDGHKEGEEDGGVVPDPHKVTMEEGVVLPHCVTIELELLKPLLEKRGEGEGYSL